MEAGLDGSEVARAEVDIFDVACHIIGGGEAGAKTTVRTKEEADRSLPSLAAAALLDGQVLPAQFDAGRITRSDVQSLLRRVQVRPASDLSARFPGEHCRRARVALRDGRVLSREERDYLGSYSRPMVWDRLLEKFHRLAIPAAGEERSGRLAAVVRRLDETSVDGLCSLLAGFRTDRSTPVAGQPGVPTA